MVAACCDMPAVEPEAQEQVGKQAGIQQEDANGPIRRVHKKRRLAAAQHPGTYSQKLLLTVYIARLPAAARGRLVPRLILSGCRQSRRKRTIRRESAYTESADKSGTITRVIADTIASTTANGNRSASPTP